MKIGIITVLLIYATTINIVQAQTPGYWQQETNYKIQVELDDEKHFLYGYEELEYINNSPDELTFIYFHLWPNAYKNNETAFARQQVHSGKTAFHYAPKTNRGYIDSLDFKINGENAIWEYHSEHIDICKVNLNQPLRSGDRITISTPFRVRIPNSYSRFGRVGQQYQITQWYPKPAVYDSKGWHEMPYLDLGEFYSEFGTFDVSITLPKNYVVGATGNLQNEEEQHFMDSIARQDWQEALFRYTTDRKDSTDEKKTIRYIQENVHDFAWFADKTYRILNGEVTLPHSGRKVKLQALYNARSYEVWQDVIDYMHDAVYYYSLWIGDYPYDIVTVVDGALSAGSGMEYPTITVLGGSDRFSLEQVVMHEIGHNWFYGVLGSNERDYAWMDEGINSYYERRYIAQKYPDVKITELVRPLIASSSLARWLADQTNLSDVPFTDLYRIAYLMQARQNLDQPLSLHSNQFTSSNYFSIVYQKSAMLFRHLESYLGQWEFDRIMQLYFQQWKFKHPQPEDLRKLFEKETGKDLTWFFDDLINTTGKINYTIRTVEKTGDDLVVEIKNNGNIESPFPLVALKNGEKQYEQWIEGFNDNKTIVIPGQATADYVVIDPDTVTLQLYPGKARSAVEGMFKKSGPLQISFPGAIEDPDKSQLFVVPAAGLNTNDKFMLGAGFYNRLFPQKKFNYFIMPMYSFGLRKLAGSAEINYHIFPGKLFNSIKLTALGKSYAGYEKIEPRMELMFKPKSFKYSPKQSLFLRYSIISIDRQALPLYDESYNVLEGRYTISGSAAVWNYGLSTGVRNKTGGFLSWENDLNVSWQYARKAFLKTRVFYGRFLNDHPVSPAYHFGMSGSFDYMMDDVFLDRAAISHDFTGFEVQTNSQHGGFKGWVPLTSDSWLAALNLDLDIPQIGLFNLFADFGFAGGHDGMVYDAGFKIGALNNAIEVYFPVIGHPFEGQSAESFRDLTNHIRFRLMLQNLNPFHILYH